MVKGMVLGRGQKLQHYGFGYALRLDEIPALRNLLKRLQTTDFNELKSLHSACKRFECAYEEDELEDQITNLMIGCEALFLRGEKTREKGN